MGLYQPRPTKKRVPDAQQYRRKANALYQLGVEHLAFWDTAITGSQASESMRRLGHKKEISDWVAPGEKSEKGTDCFSSLLQRDVLPRSSFFSIVA